MNEKCALTSIKNNMRKNFPSQRIEFLSAMRAHNRSVKAKRELEFQGSARKQEKAFRSGVSNRWTGIWNGTKEWKWNGKWNGTVNVHRFN